MRLEFRKSFGKLAAAAMALLAFQACDNIDEKDRQLDYPLPEAADKAVLIMEFTGQRCVNCPDGAAVVHALQEEYGDKMVAVGLHPQDVVFTRPYGGLDLTCATATEIFNGYDNPNQFPYAIFDGVPTADSNNYMKWMDSAMPLLQEPVVAAITAEGSFDAARNISAEVKVEFAAGYDAPLNIVVWLTEDGIIGPQQIQGGSGRDPDYKHNHVLRTSLNTAWGQQLGASFAEGEEKAYSCSLQNAAPNWNLENCNLVVFLQNPATKKVVQVTETRIVAQ